jgi:hypothetical protein
VNAVVPFADVRVLLVDADGNLFPSEEPAFVASAEVTNRFLASLGVGVRYTAEELLATTTGRNFRTTAVDLAIANGVPVEPPCSPVGAAVAAGAGSSLSAETAEAQ